MIELKLTEHMRLFLLIVIMTTGVFVKAQHTVDNIVLITLDGLRWQELFGGAMDSIMENKELTWDREELISSLYFS